MDNIVKEQKYEDGTIIKRHYVGSRNNQIAVEIEYPEDWESDQEKQDKLPLTKRTYWNPATETFVGYQRAQQLKLIPKND